MKIIKDNLDDLIVKTNMKSRNIYKNQNLNKLINYWHLFDEKEKDIMKILSESLDSVLYSKYYWCTQFVNLYYKIYSYDAGMEQQQFQITEEMSQRLVEGINWDIIQNIDRSLEGYN